jgi:hypothetical protein
MELFPFPARFSFIATAIVHPRFIRYDISIKNFFCVHERKYDLKPGEGDGATKSFKHHQDV